VSASSKRAAGLFVSLLKKLREPLHFSWPFHPKKNSIINKYVVDIPILFFQIYRKKVKMLNTQMIQVTRLEKKPRRERSEPSQRSLTEGEGSLHLNSLYQLV
jgi:hypothetical protein